MHDKFALSLILDAFSFLAFPTAAVFLTRRWGLAALVPAWACWVGALAGYGAVLGAPQLSVILIGLPLTGAALRTYLLSRSWPVAYEPWAAIWRVTLTCVLLVAPAAAIGLIVACSIAIC